MKVGVMRGHLHEFDLAQVLQVVGIGRQYTGVELSDELAVRGTIFIKSGKVVSVDAPGSGGGGREALFKLFNQNEGRFFVYRTETPAALPEPLGAVEGLLFEALERAKEMGVTGPPRSVPPFAEGETPTNIGVAPPAGGGRVPLPELASERSAEPAPTPAPAPVARRSSPPPAPQATERRTGVPPVLDLASTRRLKAALSGRILAVASPKGGCGKTTIALNLALSLARQGRSVILVDADINGDVLSAINARQRAEIGAFDVVLGVASVDEALLDTVLPHFKILPAVGGQVPRADLVSADHSAAWQSLLFQLAKRADVVIVDTPAGMFGVTHQILAAATHVVGVLQAEVVASRSFSRFVEAIRSTPEELRPEVLGIVINMLQTKHTASLSVFQSACSDLPGDWLFDTTIPRHRAFLDSTHAGLPLRHLDDQAPPAVAWLFDNLAAEAAERLRLGSVEKRPMALLI